MKLITIITLGLALILGSVGCSDTIARENKVSQKEVVVQNNSNQEVNLKINDKEFKASLNDNVNTKQILENLPIEVNMTPLARGNFLYGGNFKLAQGGFQTNFKKGDIALCKANYILVFYNDIPANNDQEYYYIGKITENLNELDKIMTGGILRIEEYKGNASLEQDKTKEVLEQQYSEMWKYMTSKNIEQLAALMSEDFTLTHMTGKKQIKAEYLTDIKNGELNYYNAKMTNLTININGNKAEMVGESEVEAAVYGGNRRTWPLRLSFTLEKINNSWIQTSCVASMY